MEDKTFRKAGFFPRLAAYVLDRLLLGALLFIPRLTAFFSSFGASRLSRAVLFRFTWTDIVLWCLCAAYFVLFTALGGATPGKKAMGLTVLGRDGGKLPFISVLCRETFGRYLSSLLCIGYLLCLVEPEKGALHDRICDSMVVYAPEKAKVDRRRAAPAPAAPAVPALNAGDKNWYDANR